MVEVNTILTFIQATGIVVGVAYYILNIQNNQRNQELSLKAQRQALETRQTQLFMYLYDKFADKDMSRGFYELNSWEWDGYDDYLQKYGWDSNPDACIQSLAFGSFFEGLGVLVKDGKIPVSMVDDLMSHVVVTYWEKFGPVTVENRRKLNYPNMGEWVEYLYNQIKPIYDKQNQ